MIDLQKLWNAMPRDVQRKISCHDLNRIVDNYNANHDEAARRGPEAIELVVSVSPMDSSRAAPPHRDSPEILGHLQRLVDHLESKAALWEQADKNLIDPWELKLQEKLQAQAAEYRLWAALVLDAIGSPRPQNSQALPPTVGSGEGSNKQAP